MVEETNLESKIIYKCEKCGWLYKNRNIAEECETWCKKHNSCNLKFVKFAIKPLELMKKRND